MRFIPLFSGSSGNASVLEAGGTTLLIDAGVTAKAMLIALSDLGIPADRIDGILVTHDHSDHIKAVGTLAKKYGLPVYANAATALAIQSGAKGFDDINFRIFRSDEDFYIGDVNIHPCRTPHDARESVGFIFTHRGRKLTYLTDIGCFRENMFNKAAGSDLVFIESNHDVKMLLNGPYPYYLKQRILSEHGHLSNENCGKALVRLYETGVRFAVLAHLSRENNTEEAAFSTVTGVLEDAGIDDMQIVVAKRDAITGIFEI